MANMFGIHHGFTKTTIVDGSGVKTGFEVEENKDGTYTLIDHRRFFKKTVETFDREEQALEYMARNYGGEWDDNAWTWDE